MELSEIFALTKEEQFALLAQLEASGVDVSVDTLDNEDVEIDDTPEIDLEQELQAIRTLVLDEIAKVEITAPKGADGKDGKPGKDGLNGKEGKNGKDGVNGKPGVDGKDGVSVVDAEVGLDGNLVIYLSNGKEVDCGKVSGEASQSVIRASTTFGNAVDFLAFNIDTPHTLLPGQMAWNKIEDCVEVAQSDGSTLQVGLEQYLQVRNATGSPLVNGTVVGFSGVNGGNIPLCTPYVASENAMPLYFIGVLTNDIPNGEVGRATVFGKVRTIDTTGSSLGETWVIGDLLWSHPTIAGKLTNIQPTAPHPAISVAAVLKVGTTDGIILVRPTIFPRLWGADWYSTADQTIAVINTPYRVTLNVDGLVSGFTNSSGLITALHTGQYNFQFSLQVTSSNSSNAYYYIWYRKNGVDAPYSATKVSIASNTAVAAPSWNFPVSMEANDTFELMWAADSTNVKLDASPATAFCPEIPSVILSAAQINL